MKWPIARTMTVAVLACCIVAVLIFWIFRPNPEPAKPAAPAPELAAVPVVTTKAPPTIRTYTPKAKVALHLPEDVKVDDRQQVVAATSAEPDTRPRTITTVIDLETGDFRTFERVEPLPWLAPAGQTAIAVGYVVKDSGPTWRAKVRRDIVQVKQLYGYAEAQMDGDRDWSAGAFIEWRF